ncbi:MAG TPA: hypothetical protein VGK19_18845 [Capsulimonadaceae bacterium]|jgi:hypothetical protein
MFTQYRQLYSRVRRILAVIAISIIAASTAPSAHGDDLATLQNMIDSAYAQGKPSVRIPAQSYLLTDPKGEGASRSLLNLRNMTRKFTIDMRGVKIVANDRIDTVVNIENSSNLTISGATIERAISPTSQGTVVGIAPDRSYVDVKVHSGYPTNLNDRFFPKVPVVNFFVPETGLIVADSRDASSPTEVTLIERGVLRFKYPLPIPGVLELGQYAAWRGVVSREVDLIDSSNISVTDTTVQGGAGFAFHEILGAGGNRYIRDTVTYPAAPAGAAVKPLLSMAADAFHSSCVKVGPSVVNCTFRGMDDDPINIHGVYFLLGKIVDATTIDADLPWPRLPIHVGDNIDFLDENRAFAGTAVIKSIESLPSYRYDGTFPHDINDFKQSAPVWKRITFTSPLPVAAKSGWLLGNRDAQGNGFEIRNCTFSESRGRLLIKANGIVSGCKLVDMGGVFDVLPEINCNESGYVTDLLIENNEIRNVGLSHLDLSAGAGALTIAQFATDGSPNYVRRPGGFRHIIVRRNRFIGNGGLNLLITSAKDIDIVDNIFDKPMNRSSTPGRNYRVPANTLVYVKHADNVAFRNNKVTSPGQYMHSVVAMDDAQSVVGADTGIGVVAASR